MNRKDAPEDAKVYLDILDHYYVGKCPCKDYVNKELMDDLVTYDDEVSAVEWKARYEAERKMRLELQSKVIALNAQLAAEKGILLG